MCGIVGANFHPNNIQQIISSLKARGPDFQNFTQINDTFFAHTRLSIIDLDDEANQPMIFDDIAIVFNGEIYNYESLKTSLNLNCITKSDTEVIIRLYQKFDIDFLELLDGIFAFAIFDKTKNRFFCARDRFGKKPFYYYSKDGKFVFSSLIQTIIKTIGYTPQMNQTALFEYLQFFTPLAPNTFYENIYKLPSSSYLIYENNLITIKKYSKISRKKTIFDEQTAVNEIENVLIKAVQKRLIGDVPMGALLSGGLDSSLISSIYAQSMDKKIDTFSVGYKEFKNYDELEFAKITAKHIKSNHYILELSQKDFIESLEKFIDTMDEPHADSAAVALLGLLDIPNKLRIKVLLSGEGSDELFFGYPTTPKLLEFVNFFHSLDKMQLNFLKSIHKSIANSTKEYEYIRRFTHGEPYYNGYGEIFTKSQKDKLCIKHKPIILQNDIADPLDNMSMTDFKIWLGEALLNKIDKIGMSKAIEIRAPFLDIDVVNTAFSIDSNVRFANHTKHLIKKVAHKYLPEEIINRKKKAFNLPFNEWLYAEYGENILEVILHANQHHKMFDENFVKRLFNESTQNNFRQHIWTLYIFSRWYEKNYL